MRTCLWALASICFELTAICFELAAGSAPAAAAVEPAAPGEAEVCESPMTPRGLALERELARTRDIYLKLDAGCRELGVLAGGVELASVPFAAVQFLVYRPARGAADGVASVELPLVVTVADDLSAASRRVVAPAFLRPYSERDEASSAAALAAPEAPDETSPPSSYRVRLEGGWALELGPRPAAHGFPARIAQALRDGWLGLAGESLERPRRIVLAIGPEDARRLHHLFRAGTRILVLAAGPD